MDAQMLEKFQNLVDNSKKAEKTLCNAADELKGFVSRTGHTGEEIEWLWVVVNGHKFMAKKGTDLTYEKVLAVLRFEYYDNGYGLQNLFGEIKFTDGTWATRYEYDGSECWQYHKAPSEPVWDALPYDVDAFTEIERQTL